MKQRKRVQHRSHFFKIQNQNQKLWHKKDVDKVVGRFVYGCSMSFNVVRSLYFTEMVEAICFYGCVYKPLHFHTFRTKVLTKVNFDLIEELKPIKDAWVTNGCTITSSGWSKTHDMPPSNVLSISVEGAYFLKSIYTSGF